MVPPKLKVGVCSMVENMREGDYDGFGHMKRRGADALVRRYERLDIIGSMRETYRPKKYCGEVIRHDMTHLQLTEDMTLDRSLTLALRNGPPLSPSRNVPPLQQNEQAAAGINLKLSLATRYVPAPRPIIDLATGTNLDLPLAISNSTYGEQSSSSQIWLEDMMNMDDPNEEHDDETSHPNMIRFL
ncbi:hypothetical protein H5410_004574 [Solanum commersonii]|uniref:Uncharacterized protein n=1 Tax=Solanum commersonii TaxID=4109 RepID=A0A9J6B867_SOLCO|nr:hypothetical protein H5410_004574 [Solanum commersonii]